MPLQGHLHLCSVSHAPGTHWNVTEKNWGADALSQVTVDLFLSSVFPDSQLLSLANTVALVGSWGLRSLILKAHLIGVTLSDGIVFSVGCEICPGG